MFFSAGDIPQHICSLIYKTVNDLKHEERVKKWEKFISDYPHKITTLQVIIDLEGDIKPSKLWSDDCMAFDIGNLIAFISPKTGVFTCYVKESEYMTIAEMKKNTGELDIPINVEAYGFKVIDRTQIASEKNKNDFDNLVDFSDSDNDDFNDDDFYDD